MRNLLLTCYLVVCSLSLQAGNDDNDSRLFSSSNENFNNANYSAALAGYNKLERSGKRSASLYTNIGDVYYKEKQYDLALLYFEKAVQIAPLDTELRFNANKAIAKLDKTVVINNSNFAQSDLSFYKRIDHLNEITISVLFVCIVAFIAFSIFGIRRNRMFFNKTYKILVVVLLVMIATIGLAFNKFQNKRYAMIVNPESNGHLGPSAASTVCNTFSPGFKLKILNRYDGWYEVSDYEDQTGWVYYSDLIEIN